MLLFLPEAAEILLKGIIGDISKLYEAATGLCIVFFYFIRYRLYFTDDVCYSIAAYFRDPYFCIRKSETLYLYKCGLIRFKFRVELGFPCLLPPIFSL